MARPQAATRAGFKGAERLFPYDHEAPALAEQLHMHGLENVLFNMPPGNFAVRARRLACLPDRNAPDTGKIN